MVSRGFIKNFLLRRGRWNSNGYEIIVYNWPPLIRHRKGPFKNEELGGDELGGGGGIAHGILRLHNS